jgi:hypothetical protein
VHHSKSSTIPVWILNVEMSPSAQRNLMIFIHYSQREPTETEWPLFLHCVPSIESSKKSSTCPLSSRIQAIRPCLVHRHWQWLSVTSTITKCKPVPRTFLFTITWSVLNGKNSKQIW